jgi:hypothetical protein
VVLCALPWFAAADWTKYENQSFIAFSNAPFDDVKAVLSELEYIRAAAEQAPSFVIPTDRPKTLVMLPATHEEFLAFAVLDTIAGFAQPLDGGAAIVMPVSAPSGNSGDVIRHEFAHTLLFNEWFRYPHWYSEGFAEIFSNIRVDTRRNTFVIGEMPERYGRRLRPRIDWKTIVDENFNAHQQPDPDVIQAAYAQDWLLVHFLTLSDNPDHIFQLDHYFSLVNTGQPSADAFTNAFGIELDSIWDSALSDYANQPATARHDFSPAVLDLDFATGPADSEQLQPVIRYLRDKADARRPGSNPDLAVSSLAGTWEQLKYRDQCTEPFTITSREAGAVIAIEGYYSAVGADPVPALFLADRMDDGVYDLINITADDYPDVTVTSDYQLTVRSETVICFDRRPFSQACTTILQRCDN